MSRQKGDPATAGSFKPGHGGGPGRPPVIRHIRELAREHTDDALRALVAIVNDIDASPSARVSAADVILDRGWGKAPATLNIRRLDEMNDPELDTYIAELQTQLGGIAAGALGAIEAAATQARPRKSNGVH